MLNLFIHATMGTLFHVFLEAKVSKPGSPNTHNGPSIHTRACSQITHTHTNNHTQNVHIYTLCTYSSISSHTYTPNCNGIMMQVQAYNDPGGNGPPARNYNRGIGHHLNVPWPTACAQVYIRCHRIGFKFIYNPG